MIKGDIRKQQILNTAETLFAERGYEGTSVQDILDVLHLSKGSFYHHFESKESVLSQICENRAKMALDKINRSLPDNGLERMNLLLSEMIPFQGEGLSFLKMILPVFILPEGKSVRNGYQEALKACWLSPTEKALALMNEQGQAFTLFPDATASIVLDLTNDLWAMISQEIIQSEKYKRDQVSPGRLLNLVDPYRSALENIMSAPYGSIELINLEQLTHLTEEIHDWWMIKPSDQI